MLGVKKGFFVTKFLVTLILLVATIYGFVKISNTTYAYTYQPVKRDYVILGGESIKLDIKTNGIIVMNDYNELESGDYIFAINDQAVTTSDFKELINGDYVNISIKRHEQIINTKISAMDLLNINQISTLKGNATITYINPDNLKYAAVAHSIIKDITISDHTLGTINSNIINSITKNETDKVGRFNSTINEQLGNINNVNEYGVYGEFTNTTNDYLIALGTKQDIHEGKAYIVTTLNDNIKRYYEININSITNANSMQIAFTITDEELMNKTNGIIKGMSGSPIVQDGLLVGSVSHTVNNNYNKGYGLLIDNMLEYTK